MVILAGDCPLVTSDLLSDALSQHAAAKHDISFVAFTCDDPTVYGRMISNSHNELHEIIEEKDATAEQKKVNICNSGVVIGQVDRLFEALSHLDRNNAQNEYYLTQIVTIARSQGRRVGIVKTKERERLMGVNTPEQLKDLEKRFFWVRVEACVEFLES